MKALIEQAMSESSRHGIDGRRKATKAVLALGITRRQLAEAVAKRAARKKNPPVGDNIAALHRDRVAFVRAARRTIPHVAGTPFVGCGDWVGFNRPTSNGGWVLICPEQRGNNLYTQDGVLVRFMDRRYRR